MPELTRQQARIEIRGIERVREMRAVEELQKEVWGCSDRDVVPALALRPAVEVGGILLGAFDEGRMVGFAYGFVGLEEGRATIHSDMLAVLPAYRDRSLGYRLKLAQRERALAQGVSVMTWTFDPLQSRNAHLNFAKLGVISARYLINYYGEETSSFLHRHTGTDRLWVRWELDGERVGRRLEEVAAGRRPTAHDFDGAARLVWSAADGAPCVRELEAAGRPARALVEIPRDVGALERLDPGLALAWRLATRRVFGAALAAGYLVEEFCRPADGGAAGSGAYLLCRGESSSGDSSSDDTPRRGKGKEGR